MLYTAKVVRTYEYGDVLYALPATEGANAANWYVVIDPAIVNGPNVIGYVTKTSIIPAPPMRGTGLHLSRNSDDKQLCLAGKG